MDDVKVGRYGAWTQVPQGDPPLNLILLTLDTTRQDRLSCYGFPIKATPNLDTLAADGALFERASTPVPVTLPAHSTILTGFYPYQHGVRNNGTYVLADRFTTLAEVLKQKGYETGAVLGGFPVDHRFGLGQGFDHYDDEFPLSSVRRESDTAQRPAADVTRLGLEWIDRQGSRPYFLWLHYFDPHFPYTPPEPYRSRFSGRSYLGEIASMDAAIGDLIAGLRARGLLEKSALLIVGDHGESLGDHREGTHSIFIYGATQRVPFILRLPRSGFFAGSQWHGRRVKGLVDLADCFPTALNLLGVGDADRPLTAGRSVLPLLEDKDAGHGWVYHETLVPQLEYTWSDLRGLETPRWKYIQAPRKELYDLSRDPSESDNLFERKPRQAEAMEAALAKVLQQDVGGSSGLLAMDQETMEKLRSLGYMAGASTPRTTGPARDPKDMIRSYEQTNAARTLVAEHRLDAALALVDSVLAQNPEDATALRIRGSCLVRLDRGDEAAALYDRLLADCKDCPDQLELSMNRAMAALAAKHLDDALARTKALVEAHPEAAGVHTLHGQVWKARGIREEARRAFTEELRRFPKDTSALVALGDLEATSGRNPEAEAAYRKAIALNPYDADALVRLSEVWIATGREQAAKGLIDQALSADPYYPGALFRKAWFLRKEGKTDEARHYYEQALMLQPDNEVVLYNLGNLYMQTGNFKQALDLYRRAVQTGRASQDVLLNMGVIHAQMGSFAEAIAQWERAIELDPRSDKVPGIRQNIAMAREKLQR